MSPQENMWITSLVLAWHYWYSVVKWKLFPVKNLRPIAFESSFSVNRCIWEFSGDIAAFCLDIKAWIFYFSFFNVSHNSLSFITWNLTEYLHTQDFQRATAHLNVWTNTLLSNFSENSADSIQTLFE